VWSLAVHPPLSDTLLPTRLDCERESRASLQSRACRGTSPAARLAAAALRGNTTVTGGTGSNEHRKHDCIRVAIAKSIHQTHQVRAHRSRLDDRERTCHERIRTGHAGSAGHTAAASAGGASGESRQSGDSDHRHVGRSSNATRRAAHDATIGTTNHAAVRTTNDTAIRATNDAALRASDDTAIRAAIDTTAGRPR
jgi:hypothetical protein